MNRGVVLFGMICLLAMVCQAQENRQEALTRFADHVFYLSEVMLHDVANPPAASRFYAYSLLGAYEAAYLGGAHVPGLDAKFAVDPGLKAVARPKNFDLEFASLYAMLDVGRQIMPSGHLLQEKLANLTARVKAEGTMSSRELTQHVRYAEAIAAQVVQYARSDGYNKLSTYTRYTPKKEEGHWYPTPPEYMGAVEPRWETIRPFFLDSASQFGPKPPVPFSKDTTSAFYRQMMEVYEVTGHLSDEQRLIASFWDCNPFAVAYSGHMAIGLKKISPGGHWMGIAGIACKTADVPLDSAILIQTMVALTLHDAFVSCWQEKYHSDRIRPETIINKLVDESWRPLLQTPPFPEYTSGHSVASASAATVLTYFLGEPFSFLDTSEVYFGLPERSFNSFFEASNEAAISRLFGGIHFRDACEEGVKQGRRIGDWVLKRYHSAGLAAD